MVVARPATGVPATSEAAVLALLALGGEGSGYELTKRVGRAIGYVWAPARPTALTTRPDVAALLTVEDFLAGREPVLERALRLR